MKTIILYGGQGCGKTTYAKKLQKHFGCDSIVDDWTPQDRVFPNALHLTSDNEVGDAVYALGRASDVLGLYQFNDVMEIIKRKKSEKKTVKGEGKTKKGVKA